MIKRILFVFVVLGFAGCTTNPQTGEQTWDVDATLRAVGAAVGAVQQKPAPVAPDNYNRYE